MQEFFQRAAAGPLHRTYLRGFSGTPCSLRRIGYRSDHSQGGVSWFGIWVMASSCHSSLVSGIRLPQFLLSGGIVALVCPHGSAIYLTYPYKAGRPVFQGASGCLPQRLFHAFHSFSRISAIYLPTALSYFSQNPLCLHKPPQPRLTGLWGFSHISKSFNPASMVSKS